MSITKQTRRELVHRRSRAAAGFRKGCGTRTYTAARDVPADPFERARDSRRVRDTSLCTYKLPYVYRGVRDPAILAEGAGRALERIMWVQEHAAAIVTASAHQEHLADVEADEAKKKESEHEE